MKICAILSILALAAPSAVATKRKRIFKVYSPDEIRRLEGLDDEEQRLLKGDKPKIQEDMSMSMSMSMPTNPPKPPNPFAADSATGTDDKSSG